MTLSCSCEEGSDDTWWYYPPNGYRVLETRRRRRCCSCNDLISIGAICGEFPRMRSPDGDIEECIYGEEVPLSPKWQCERCTDLFFSLEDLGFCLRLGDDLS